MSQDWEWFEPSNPDRLFIIKTSDLYIKQIGKNFTKQDIEQWLKNDSIGYMQRCMKRCKEQKYFNFLGFDDMLDFVKTKGYIPGFIRVMIERDGNMVIEHGYHRWMAAYLCGIKEVQAKLCKRK